MGSQSLTPLPSLNLIHVVVWRYGNGNLSEIERALLYKNAETIRIQMRRYR